MENSFKTQHWIFTELRYISSKISLPIFNLYVPVNFLEKKECWNSLADFFATCSASCEEVWLRKLLSDLFDLQLDATCINCEKQGCVMLSEKPVFYDKSNHIKIKYHYIRDMVQRRAVKLRYVTTKK